MQCEKLNKPFVSYVITQSTLVVIVLFASFIATEALAHQAGVSVSRLTVSLWMVGLSQLPTALLYATHESRTLTPKESWGLGFSFVVIALIAEVALQLVAGQIWPKIQILRDLTTSGSWRALMLGVCGILLGIIAGAFIFKTLFKYSVRNNLEGEPPAPDTAWLENLPRVKVTLTVRELHPTRIQHDYSRLFRRVLIIANIGIFAISLIYPGLAVWKVLTVSIPLSILFAVIVVANGLAKAEAASNIIKRCLQISWKLLPLTLTALLLLGINNLYLANIQSHGQTGQLFSDLAQTGVKLGAILHAFAYLVAFFMTCLLVNAGLLALFYKLIRPLVLHSTASNRPHMVPLIRAVSLPDDHAQEPRDWVQKSPEILAVLKRAKGSHRNKHRQSSPITNT